MIDFHAHILPGIDDGSESIDMSLAMLRECTQQGVDVVYATPHFYADEDEPRFFIERRNRSYKALLKAMNDNPYHYPKLKLGAEILYYPGISGSSGIEELSIEDSLLLLIEPPMTPWTDFMLDEIEEIGNTLCRLPVIAHIDRYMRVLDDYSLLDRLENRRILKQVNTSYFLSEMTVDRAIYDLKMDRFQFIGSDCHNMSDRPPNLMEAAEVIRNMGASKEFSDFNFRLYDILS